LWRAVDHDDNALDILVQSRRNTKAAKQYLCKWLKGLQYVPQGIMTEGIRLRGDILSLQALITRA
jgi:putative transposase